MKKRFILLIDFSEGSSNLIKYASQWAKRADAELLLVHQTIVVAPGFADSESKREYAERANDEALGKLRSMARNHIAEEIKVSYAVSEKHLQPILAQLVAEPFEDLIFVGLKGTGRVKKLLLGSVALDVINTADNCIVAMPKEIDAFCQVNLHVSVTEKYPLNLLAFNNYLKFLDKENIKLHFFHLAGPKDSTQGIEKHLRELSQLFAHRFETDHAIFEGTNVFEDLKEIVKNRADEVLVVQRGSRFLTDQLFRKYLINELVYEGQTPLVVLP